MSKLIPQTLLSDIPDLYVHGSLGLSIERDESFRPMLLSKIKEDRCSQS